MGPTSSMLRLFVAAPIPDAVQTTLLEAQRELRKALSGATTSWTRPEALHLTLRFLGSVEASQVPELSRRLVAGLAGFGALELACAGLGCFPDARRPQVVWAGAGDAAGRLGRLHQAVDEAVRELAEKPAEARFVGHVTLARPKVVRGPEVERLARVVEAAIDRPFGTWRCASLALVQSEPTSSGSRYTTLASVGL